VQQHLQRQQAFTPIGAGSLFYNTKDYNFRLVGERRCDRLDRKDHDQLREDHAQAYVQVIQLSGNNLSNPIAQSAYASGNNTNPYTANLSSAPTSGNGEVDFLSANEDLSRPSPSRHPP